MPSIQEDAEVFHAVRCLAKESIEANIETIAAWTYLSARGVKSCLYSLSASNKVTSFYREESVEA